MNETEKKTFESHLKGYGKKPNVIEGLVHQVNQFEQFLQAREKELGSANEQDVLDFAAGLENNQPGSAGKRVRGLVLYFRFTGQVSLAEMASGIWEDSIAKKRNVFKLSDFRGVNPEHIVRLKAAGIADIEHMLAAGKTAAAKGIPARSIELGTAPEVQERAPCAYGTFGVVYNGKLFSYTYLREIDFENLLAQTGG